MKRTNFMMAIALTVAVSSCQQDEIMENRKPKEDAAREIGFVNISDM